MTLNTEKQRVIATDGNVLVTANPGTGKTLLLAHKYLALLKEGLSAKDILCLTFTEKARQEMESKISDLLTKEGRKEIIPQLQVYTFHAYALEHIRADTIVSSNLLRYSIYAYMREQEMLNYGEEYLLGTIVPKMENLIRYLKSFGVMPDHIDLEAVRALLMPGLNYSKEEIDAYAGYFRDVFSHYEAAKASKGVDYADLLISFLQLKTPPHFEVVLVDELQDVNVLEADIALKSASRFIAVGDKKQAIFGFQGGSILNFAKFSDAQEFVLSENFRSTDAILGYAREFMIAGTKDASIIEEVGSLRNAEGTQGDAPRVYEVAKRDSFRTACALATQLASSHGSVAIISRTNHQLVSLAKELDLQGVPYSTTFFSASADAKQEIIAFLTALLTLRADDVRPALFTPFFPCSMQEAFALAEQRDLSMEDIVAACPRFGEMRSLRGPEDVLAVFSQVIFPVAMAYGKGHFFAALSVFEAFQEALALIKAPSLQDLLAYLQSADLATSEQEASGGITLTTVHKAKGKEYDAVVYLPATPRGTDNFQDAVVRAILLTKGIDAQEELSEEDTRVNFVAFTRAKRALCIVTENAPAYLLGGAIADGLTLAEAGILTPDERGKRAYSLFLSGDTEGARGLLERKRGWLAEHVAGHFKGLKHVSYSSLKNSAYEYLHDVILHVWPRSFALQVGSMTHAVAEGLCKGTVVDGPYKEQLQQLLDTITQKYPTLVGTEEKVLVPVADVFGIDAGLLFKGKIDAVFRNKDEYLIVDWKTDRDTSRASGHRQQLEAYRRAYAAAHEIPLDRIRVAIGYCALRGRINTGNAEAVLDEKQPADSAIKTLGKRLGLLLAWKEDVGAFFDALMAQPVEDGLWRAVVEECNKEAR